MSRFEQFNIAVMKVDEASPYSGLIYPRETMQRELDKLQPSIKSARCLGPVSKNMRVELSKVSFVIRRAWIDEHDMIRLCVEPLSNGDGTHLKGLLKTGIVRLATCGMGTVHEDRVTEDYELLGFTVESKDPPAVPAKPVVNKDAWFVTPRLKARLLSEKG